MKRQLSEIHHVEDHWVVCCCGWEELVALRWLKAIAHLRRPDWAVAATKPIEPINDNPEHRLTETGVARKTVVSCDCGWSASGVLRMRGARQHMKRATVIRVLNRSAP